MKWTFAARNDKRPVKQMLYTLEWYWYTYAERIAYAVAAVLLAVLSICVVWSESVFWIATIQGWQKPGRELHLSIFYWLLNANEDMNVLLQWLVIFVPCGYIAYCAYWSMFQLRIMNYYRLIPHQQTDEYSILFSAYYVCRLTAPMVYNFLLMLDDRTSAYVQLMGMVNIVPLLGDWANAYLPLFLIVLCAMNVFNVWTWLTTTCCLKRFRKFTYDEDFSDERIDQGAEIISKERSFKERGLALSLDQIDGSLLKRKQKKTSVFPSLNLGIGNKFSFFGKKNAPSKEDKIELLEMSRRGREEV